MQAMRPKNLKLGLVTLYNIRATKLITHILAAPGLQFPCSKIMCTQLKCEFGEHCRKSELIQCSLSWFILVVPARCWRRLGQFHRSSLTTVTQAS